MEEKLISIKEFYRGWGVSPLLKDGLSDRPKFIFVIFGRLLHYFIGGGVTDFFL